jgi:hypothetical protein
MAHKNGRVGEDDAKVQWCVLSWIVRGDASNPVFALCKKMPHLPYIHKKRKLGGTPKLLHI